MSYEDFVTYDQAVVLKELDFDWKCNHYYDSQTKEFLPENCFDCDGYIDADDLYDSNPPKDIISYKYFAPTLAQVQKWLREKEIEVGVFGEFDGELRTNKWVWLMRKFNTHLFGTVFTENSIRYDTYEEALSAGIDKALELLKSL